MSHLRLRLKSAERRRSFVVVVVVKVDAAEMRLFGEEKK
jgi:hypothetical protein